MERSRVQKRRKKAVVSLPSLPSLHGIPQESTQIIDSTQLNEFINKESRPQLPKAGSHFFTLDNAKRLRTSLAPKKILHKINARKKKLEEDLQNNRVIQEVAQAYGLSPRQLRKLRRKFKQIDLDDSGSIERKELFLALEEEQTVVTDAFFDLFDIDSTGHIELEDFIQVCSTYCVYSRKDILKFCFDCFDTDASGFIDEDEYKRMCRSVNNGFPSFPGNFSNALEMFDTNGDGVIDLKEFIDLDKRFPMLMFPAFRLQEKMQKLTLGEHQWTKINEQIERSRNRIYTRNKEKTFQKGILEENFLPRLHINERHQIRPEDVDKMKRI